MRCAKSYLRVPLKATADFVFSRVSRITATLLPTPSIAISVGRRRPVTESILSVHSSYLRGTEHSNGSQFLHVSLFFLSLFLLKGLSAPAVSSMFFIVRHAPCNRSRVRQDYAGCRCQGYCYTQLPRVISHGFDAVNPSQAVIVGKAKQSSLNR